MSIQSIKWLLTAFIFLPFSAQSQYRNYWRELENSFTTRNHAAIEKACKDIIANEGLDLSVLLSVLYANGIPLSGKEAVSIIPDYNNLKSSFFQTRQHLFHIDSIYTETYIFHRNEKILREQKLKPYEKRVLIRFNERVKARYSTAGDDYNYYGYLKAWLQHADKSEDELILTFLRDKGIKVDRLLSYEQLCSLLAASTQSIKQFDTAAQKRLTYYRTKAKENEDKGLFALALHYVDSIALQFPNLYANDFEQAQRVAMKQKMGSFYLHFLTMGRGNPIVNTYYKDTLPTYGRSKEDTAFVKGILKTFDFTDHSSTQPLPSINYDLLLLSNRFAELHNFGSNISYPKNKLSYLVENKARKQNLYLGYVEESFQSFPFSILLLVRSADDWNKNISANFSYINLHLLQYNANGQRVHDDIFLLFKRTNEHLVKLGIYDLEDYYWTEDYFLTAVKHKPSNYGWQMGKGNFSEKTVINKTTIENREKNFLLPFKLLKR